MRAATPLERAPAFGDPLEPRRVGAPFQVQGELGAFLQRKVAGGEGVRVAEAEQEENIRRPWAYPFDRDQRLVGVLGVESAKALKIEAALCDRLGDRPQGADFGVRQPAGPQVLLRRLGDFSRLERDDQRLQPAENGGGAGGRHLLRHDDCGQAREARLSASKQRSAADRDQAVDQLRVFGAQALSGFAQGLLVGDRGPRMVDPFLRRSRAPGCSDARLTHPHCRHGR